MVAGSSSTKAAGMNIIVKQVFGRMLVNNKETSLIAVRDLEHLFVDPEKDPFSLLEVASMGESGLSHIIQLFIFVLSCGSHKYKHLIVLLPHPSPSS